MGYSVILTCVLLTQYSSISLSGLHLAKLNFVPTKGRLRYINLNGRSFAVVACQSNKSRARTPKTKQKSSLYTVTVSCGTMHFTVSSTSHSSQSVITNVSALHSLGICHTLGMSTIVHFQLGSFRSINLNRSLAFNANHTGCACNDEL